MSDKQQLNKPAFAMPGPGPRGPAGGQPAGSIKVRPKNTAATIKRIWNYLNKQRSALLIVYLFTILSALIALAGPYLIGVAIDDYIVPGDYTGLIRLCMIMLALYLLGSIVTWIQSYVMTSVSQKTVLHLRNDLFGKYQDLPVQFFDTRNNGELMSRATNDIENVSNTLNQSVTQLLNSLVTLIGSLVIMLSLNVPLTLVALISIPLVLISTRQIVKYTRIYFKGQQQQLGQLNGMIEETISGQKVVKLYRREEQETVRFKDISEQLNKVGIKAQIVSGMMGPFMNVINNLSFALIAAVGGWMVFQNEMVSVGIVVSFLNYSKQFGRPISELANQYNLIQSAVAGAERVFEIMDLKSEYEDEQDHGKTPTNIQGSVKFDQVNFHYKPEKPILTDISFEAHPGEKIALVGPTGAGKTTIVNLLTRFYETASGDILVDGRSIRSLDKKNLRKQLGMVLQDAHVFSGTIRDNIAFGRLDATDEEIQQAAVMANADPFIRRLPDGYDTKLSAEGGNLSHGQRQLLTIARAILANPAILILDEATSSVDTRTEMYIQEAMKTLMQGRTSFVIAHRLSTIQDADRILYMENGCLVEQGTHEELLAIGPEGRYYKLFTSQFHQAI
ncbi:multidrug ABC transporter ATP-binding protein [Paenibacillus sp. FSL H7-0326]|uniref:ABC transporter ATP-binding protein n=1 Tax=Paenibacillus sp. FSL H7-0326 TaxID=1921144 RepID=UPI00096D6FE3|nr:ABC transporter ATP-binding protein [Paenibacillus sp. FSL H7-0326]OMC71654.1 multidrug ABC transporter ATP-binding protein [Paenibacillus sp. FSL H7-0326]